MLYKSKSNRQLATEYTVEAVLLVIMGLNAINEIGHVMGKKTIAWFVGNDEIKNMLTVLGLDYAQS